jgi:hypothetical protein
MRCPVCNSILRIAFEHQPPEPHQFKVWCRNEQCQVEDGTGSTAQRAYEALKEKLE